MATVFHSARNDVRSTLAQPYVSGSGSLTVADGSLFGSPTPSAPIRLTVVTAASYGTYPETSTVFTCTGRTDNVLTGVAAIEGTTDRDYAVGSYVEARLTAGHLSDLHTAVNTLEANDTTLSGQIALLGSDVSTLDLAVQDLQSADSTLDTRLDTVETTLPNKSDVGHLHDERYYTESETDTLLATKAPLSHPHPDLVTLATTQTITGTKTFSATVTAPRVDVGTTSVFTGQGGPVVLSTRYSDNPNQYPYLSLRVAGGTEGSPAGVAVGRWAGGLLAYAYHQGGYQGVGGVTTQVTATDGSFLKGRLAFQVNAGADGGANLTVMSLDSTGITLYRPTEVRGELSVVDPATLLKLRVVPQGPAEPTFQFQIGSTPAFGVRSNARTQFNTGMELNSSGTFRVGTSDCQHGLRRGSSAWLELDDSVGARLRVLTTSYLHGLGVELTGNTTVGAYIRGGAAQTANLTEWQNSSSTVLSAVRADGSWKPPALADTAAANDSLYYSTDAGKLAYKDPSGVVHPLY